MRRRIGGLALRGLKGFLKFPIKSVNILREHLLGQDTKKQTGLPSVRLGNTILRILVLNPYFPTLGGGEKSMGYICQFMEDFFDSRAQIDILVHNYDNIRVTADKYPSIRDLEERFAISLNRTNLVKFDQVKLDIEGIASNYDLFVNHMFQSKHRGTAKKNIYICMFPPKKEPYVDLDFVASYDFFLTNSAFTEKWLSRYWGENEQYRVVYPPVLREKELDTRYSEGSKKDIILAVGRFQMGFHCKKQDVMVNLYNRYLSEFGDYELHLVGGVIERKSDLRYVKKIKEKITRTNRIFLHINSSPNELDELYRRAKIFWHMTGYGKNEQKYPEKMEHFGITTVEAMSYGAVPVVINKGAQPEIVQSGFSGYTWDSGRECVEYTRNLIRDEDLRRVMSKNAVNRCKLFTIEKFYERSRTVFDEL
ncbi:glycosyltransferase family 4 protein [Syntrophorhabdus aromaticivorans]|uniref:glycosyltransferase family 4 protein n=1 Tax=Syntrophorhabdus aromaticivorans TaxID=328301 RepID=UPI0018DCBFCF|nr:glycosyltransferase family 4 protein [Syntrophorhabdus aromaticivorans]